MTEDHKLNRRERRAALRPAKGLNPLSLPIAEERRRIQAEREEAARKHQQRVRTLAHLLGSEIQRVRR